MLPALTDEELLEEASAAATEYAEEDDAPTLTLKTEEAEALETETGEVAAQR